MILINWLAKEWYGLTITINNDGTITWDFPA